MKTALVIMAAGIGSRFGGGIKQLAAVGPNGEIIMDYSIHDAIEAGFDKIVFIIRHDIEEAFKARASSRSRSPSSTPTTTTARRRSSGCTTSCRATRPTSRVTLPWRALC